MARKPRFIQGGLVYHVMNRAAARARCFHKDADYAAFECVLEEAVERFRLRLLAYCLMPNHFHLVLWPAKGQEKALSHFMQWLQQTHTQRWHAHYHNAGTGRLYQGRFRAFPIQAAWNCHTALRRVCRYVEANPRRAKLVKRAQDWTWSSLARRLENSPEAAKVLAPWPAGSYPGNARWLALVHAPMRHADEFAVQTCIAHDRPHGDEKWTARTAAALGLDHTLRPRGRPRKIRPGKKPRSA